VHILARFFKQTSICLDYMLANFAVFLICCHFMSRKFCKQNTSLTDNILVYKINELMAYKIDDT